MSHRAKKSLGQHFLRSKSAIRSIVASGNVSARDMILEIGPGEGVLTEALLATDAQVVAVEKDRDLMPLLAEKFARAIASGQLTLVEADILDFDPAKHGLHAGRYKLIANIPYYITGAIFEKFLTEKNPPSCLVVLIQKEVATRIVARDKKESILSISVKAFGTPRITEKVPASAFRPAPKVDSAILLVSDISSRAFEETESGTTESKKTAPRAAITHFFAIVRAGFAHKRKILARNLESVAQKSHIMETFASIGLSPNVRAEELTLPEWHALARSFTEKL